MELHVTAEAEAKPNALAQRTHRGADELEEAVDRLVAYNEWFEEKVREGLVALERGEVVPDQEVRTWLDRQRDRERAQAIR